MSDRRLNYYLSRQAAREAAEQAAVNDVEPRTDPDDHVQPHLKREREEEELLSDFPPLGNDELDFMDLTGSTNEELVDLTLSEEDVRELAGIPPSHRRIENPDRLPARHLIENPHRLPSRRRTQNPDRPPARHPTEEPRSQYVGHYENGSPVAPQGEEELTQPTILSAGSNADDDPVIVPPDSTDEIDMVPTISTDEYLQLVEGATSVSNPPPPRFEQLNWQPASSLLAPNEPPVFGCEGCDDFGCIRNRTQETAVVDCQRVNDNAALAWLYSHGLVWTTPYCVQLDHQTPTAFINGTFRCPFCSKTYSTHGPLLSQQEHFGAGRMIATIWLYTHDRTVDEYEAVLHAARTTVIRHRRDLEVILGRSMWLRLQTDARFAWENLVADEIYVGQRTYNRGHPISNVGLHWFSTAVRVEVGSDGREHIVDAVIAPLARRSGAAMQAFVLGLANPWAHVTTDQHRSYVGLSQYDISHDVVNHSEEFVNAQHQHTNSVEAFNGMIRARLRRGHGGHVGHNIQDRVNRMLSMGIMAQGSLRARGGSAMVAVLRAIQLVAVNGISFDPYVPFLNEWHALRQENVTVNPVIDAIRRSDIERVHGPILHRRGRGARGRGAAGDGGGGNGAGGDGEESAGDERGRGGRGADRCRGRGRSGRGGRGGRGAPPGRGAQ